MSILVAAFAARTAFALDGSAEVTGGEVKFFGASEMKWLNGTELLLRFDVGEGSFVLPGLTKARILAIGGGGGGGGIYSTRNGMVVPFGAGGGGGGGGYVEVTNVFSAATYAVTVGRGGEGGASSTLHSSPYYVAESGYDTTVVVDGETEPFIRAVGGGGGGGETDGLNGGSGGGGSQYRRTSGASGGTTKVGGSGTDGQGYSGGAGNASLYGGGGGGAGGAGAAASTMNPVGGDGKPSDITGEEVWYAGGGGGGFSDKSFTGVHDPISGGRGGGGCGGYGLNVAATDASFYGGGGGGCGALATGATTPGGSGFNGVVYVRISVVAVAEIVKPTNQTIDFDGAEHVLVPAHPAYKITDLTEGSDTYEQQVERMAGTAAGTYKAKVTLVDGFEWSTGGREEVIVTLVINKAVPVFSKLLIRSWVAGIPEEAIPVPSYKLNIAVEPEFTYSTSETGPWSAERPSAVGPYYLRAHIEETDSNYAAEEIVPFEIINGPGDKFRDYVEVKIAGAAAESIGFIYELNISEDSPVGFLYSRAGDTGSDIAITDAGGNPLDFKVVDWNIFGTSTIHVKLPTLKTTEQVLRIFWCLRDGAIAPEYDSDIESPSGGTQPTCEYDLVVRDGKRVNYWLKGQYPTLSKYRWDSLLESPAVVESYGKVKEGTTALLYVTNLNTGAVLPPVITSAGGSFSAVFGPDDQAGDYEPLEYGLDYFVVGHLTYTDLGGDYSGDADALTRNGRVLLVNDDSAAGGYSVAGQSYWQTDSEKYSTYWTHSDTITHLAYLPNLRDHKNHVLYSKDANGDSRELWKLEYVMIGNQYLSSQEMPENRCALPYSSTSKPISSETATPGIAESANMVMCNKLGASITSPNYTNGVGTIYFDVVNGETTRANATLYGYYKIKVEVSTDGGANWSVKKMLPFKRNVDPGDESTKAFVPDQTLTEELVLEIEKGGTADNFYRVCVPVDLGGNVQFRIIRTAQAPDSRWAEEQDGFILVDNILVSYPKSTASLEPYGEFDKELVGRQVLGWAGAMSVPFPAAGQPVYARAKALVNTNSNTHASSDMPITWAQMHYRWRYLDQLIGEWQEPINLRPSAGFASTRPIDIPAMEGDVEFYYDYIVQVPAYSYHDYSGANLGLLDADGNALYSEEITASTNNQLAVTGIESLASGGTDWFFRLRRGRSDWESAKLYVKESEDGAVAEYDMSLVGNHIWRGFCPTRKTLEDGLYIRVANFNKQTAGGDTYEQNTNRYSLAANASSLPATGNFGVCSDDESWQWLTVPCDGKTGQILVQFQDDTLTYSIVHADYQDFNGWTDAHKQDGKGIFVGTSTDTNSSYMAGTTAEAISYESRFERWKETVATNEYWSESFPATKAQLDAGAWTLYEPFEEAESPNTSFSVGNGQWVNGWYRWNGTSSFNPGMAFQMEGKGKGYIQLVDFAQSPRGLESVTFKARVAQSISFNDFAYSMTHMTAAANYTFLTAAAFDTNTRKDFAGNASLSLVGLYTPNEGCYELRVEQDDATVTSAGVISPGPTFRISLYRWAFDDEQGEVVATLIGSDRHSNGSSMFNTANSGTGASYARLFISVDTSVEGETRVTGGVSRDCVQNSKFFDGASYRCVMTRDTASERLVSGSFGVLSANCPARFAKPSYAESAITYQAASKTGFQYGTYTLTPVPVTSRKSCQADISNGRWSIPKTRMEKAPDDTNWYGIHAKTPTTSVKVYTAPAGTVKWSLLKEQEVTGFGSSSSSGATTIIPIYSLDEVSVRITAGGNYKTGRTDVTIDDIEFRQWRGESYDERGQTGVFDSLPYGSPTNIVFTQGWISNRVDSSGVTNKFCVLSAKRSKPGVPTTIRSPRMVNELDEGLGLGMVAFNYVNAQSNAVLLVQIATNENDLVLSSFAGVTASATEEYWTTVTNIDFSAMTAAERASGTFSCYVGLHGIKGAMRIAVDPKKITAVTNVTDATAFGEVTITGVKFRDEPELDKYSWWGWNLCTTDDADKRSLADNAGDPLKNGMSFGLNNSITADTRPQEEVSTDQYAAKAPFLQTPTFATNLVNEVSFLARLYNPLYDPSDPYTPTNKARVTLYGAKSGDITDEGSWTRLYAWDITNSVYETYSLKFGAGNSYQAFRLAVVGVDGITELMPGDGPTNNVNRVLLDEVLVMEGIVASVSFRNVGAFRFGLDKTTASEDVPSPTQQPLCGEEWGVQCEVFAAQLADEIDLSTARVRLWWYDGDTPWGFDRWRDRSETKNAWLMQAEETNLVFRSSYFGASSAVMKAQLRPITVQYMLEVIYRANGRQQTNWLSAATSPDSGWVNPRWYSPLDYNADRGEGAFAAYTILDTVAPGWAWLNEVNIFGKFEGWNYDNTDKDLQFLEIAAPSEADMSEWSVRFVEANVNTGKILTNEVARFGANGLPGIKKGLVGMDTPSKCVFHVITSPLAKSSLSSEDGRNDGSWLTPRNYSGSAFSSSGELNPSYPQSIQLVRPSGIVEHEVVFLGTNDYYNAGEEYRPENHVSFLNAHERGGRWFYAGMDSEGIPENSVWSRSLGVFSDNGSSPLQWNSAKLMTPGRINGGQTIASQPPKPQGSALIIYSIIHGDHLAQSFGDETNIYGSVTLMYRKGSDTATNITYRADLWHELGPVTVNDVTVEPVPTGNEREWVLPVGAATSNDLTVVASAKVDSTLENKYGITPENRYRNAIIEWLTRKTDARGKPWRNQNTTELGIADKFNINDSSITNMSLTEMYWFDIDPTWNDHDIVLNSGWITPPVRKVGGDGEWTCRVFMQISNTVNDTTWAPYVLQGCEFANNSSNYAVQTTAELKWTNETFKITGLLASAFNDLSEVQPNNWIPQRWFVFVDDSFDSDFTSVIELPDPFSMESPGFNAGWYKWRQENPGKGESFWFQWDVSDRGWPSWPEVLKKENPW